MKVLLEGVATYLFNIYFETRYKAHLNATYSKMLSAEKTYNIKYQISNRKLFMKIAYTAYLYDL